MEKYQAFLVALNNGLPPHAEPLVCGEIIGPGSLFGEESPLPRPLFRLEEGGAGCRHLAKALAYARSTVLWGDGLRGAQATLAVPATTFLAGRVSSAFDLAWYLHGQDILPEWGAVVAASQKQGRGQLRRHWHSPVGNLYAVVRLPADPHLQSEYAALVMGFLLVTALERVGCRVYLKWPNDILTAEGRKVGGILLEERNGTVLAGIGINLAEAPAPAQLRQGAATPAGVLFSDEGQGGAAFAPFSLWQSLVHECIIAYSATVFGGTCGAVLGEISHKLAWQGENITVYEEDLVVFCGKNLGLSPCGGLLLQGLDGTCKEITSGSISLGLGKNTQQTS